MSIPPPHQSSDLPKGVLAAPLSSLNRCGRGVPQSAVEQTLAGRDFRREAEPTPRPHLWRCAVLCLESASALFIFLLGPFLPQYHCGFVMRCTGTPSRHSGTPFGRRESSSSDRSIHIGTCATMRIPRLPVDILFSSRRSAARKMEYRSKISEYSSITHRMRVSSADQLHASELGRTGGYRGRAALSCALPIHTVL